MKKISKILLGLGLISVASTTVFAGTETKNVTVGADVAADCHFTDHVDLAFGTYNPYNTTVTAQNGSVTFTCSKDTPWTLGLDSNDQVLTDSNNNTLNYTVNLSQTSGTSTSSTAAISVSLQGEIAADQDAYAESNYSDTITVSLNW